MSINNLKFSFDQKETITRYLIAKRIVDSKTATNAEYLLCDSPRQVSIHNKNACTVGEGGYILVDFGSEIHGGIELSVGDLCAGGGGKRESGRVRIVFGESVSEALSAIGDGNNALNDHSTRDMTVDTTFMSTMRYGFTGFRFVKIEPVGCSIDIVSLKGVFEYRDIPYLGSFECNDTRLNDVFNTAAYTVHLNMQDYIWDGIKRDRLVWIGDMHPEVSAIARVFGHNSSVEKSLDYTREAFPIESAEKDVWMIFPSYSCCWLMIHRDWYLHNGNFDYLLEQKDYIYKLCEQILRCIDEDGTLHFKEKYFIDWSSKNTAYMEAGFRGCLIMGLKAASDIVECYGDNAMAARLDSAVDYVKKQLPPHDGNKQVCAMAALAGLCDKESALKIIKTDLLEGLSTFYGYYVLQLLGETNNTDAAIDILKGYWGAMLDLGATTFWEDFDIKWTENAARIDEIVPEGKHDVHAEYGKFCYQKLRHSLCHGWASGPAAYLSRYILGVEIVKAGCKTLKVAPQMAKLEWVKGTVPTPLGVVKVEHRYIDGELCSKIEAPEGIEIICENKVF